MIIKGYKRKGTGFAGQDQESWTGVWGSVQDLKKSFDNADSDYLAPFFRKFFPRPPGKILEGGCGIGKYVCLLYTSPSPRDRQKSRMPSSA